MHRVDGVILGGEEENVLKAVALEERGSDILLFVRPITIEVGVQVLVGRPPSRVVLEGVGKGALARLQGSRDCAHRLAQRPNILLSGDAVEQPP